MCKLFTTILGCAVAALLLAEGQLSAGTICPNFTANPITSVSGCNAIITITSTGVSISTVDTHPYENVEDQLVGVVNNSNAVVTSLPLTGSNIFGFDGDGLCSGFITCTFPHPTGYEGASLTGTTVTSFTNFSSGNSGIVNFAPGIPANGGTAWFDLEEAPGIGTITVGGVPEPGTISMLGAGLISLAIYARRRKYFA